MEEKKFTDEEIVKALDICYTTHCCTNECPYFNKNGRNFCMEDKAFYKGLKDLVNRQKAEIEAWKAKSRELEQSWEIASSNEEKLRKQVDELTEDRNKQRKLYVKEFAEHANHLGEFEKIKQQAVKDTAKEIWNDITSHYFALRVIGNATVELDKLAEFWHKRGVEVE